MKKTIFALVVIVAVTALVVASFIAGSITARSSDTSGSGEPEAKNPVSPVANDGTDDKTEVNTEMVEKIVFFSPNTGSDDTGNGSQGSPVETKKQAEKIAEGITVGEGEELIYLEYLMTVDVKTQAAAGVFSDAGGVNMIPFTGSTDGYYFKGDIVGTGCDTQKYLPNDGGVLFSARYMLKGTDHTGQSCSIFIENNGMALEKCTPTIITDSRALSDWQNYELRAIVVPVGGGVEVNVYRIHR